MVGINRGSTPRSQQNISMRKELELIEKIEVLIAHENHTYTLLKQFGRVPQQHRDMLKKRRRELKLYCAERRLAIIAERNQQKSLPQQAELF